MHAELRVKRGELWIKDRGSSNGTFVNQRRITSPTRLREGDLLHLATHEVVVGCIAQTSVHDPDDDTHTQIELVDVLSLRRQSVAGTHQLRDLLKARAVSVVFQPIVVPTTVTTRYFELLGRGAFAGLPTGPYDLFRIAAEIGAEAELSALFRSVGLTDAHQLSGPLGLFLNVHPCELHDTHWTHLLQTLAQYRDSAPQIELIAEIHESAVLDRQHLTRIQHALRDLGIKLAYDDFGAGQARLLELAEVPCDYLKFDMSMIRNIDRAPLSRQRLVASLVQIACDLDITCLAEGIETPAEWQTCQQMGFTCAQGFHFGRPAPVEVWKNQGAGIGLPVKAARGRGAQQG